MDNKEFVKILVENEDKALDVIRWNSPGKTEPIVEGVTLRCISDAYTLGEIGDGVTYQCVFEHLESGKKYAMNVTHSSWDSDYYEIDQTYEVVETTKTVTVYLPVDGEKIEEEDFEDVTGDY